MKPTSHHEINCNVFATPRSLAIQRDSIPCPRNFGKKLYVRQNRVLLVLGVWLVDVIAGNFPVSGFFRQRHDLNAVSLAREYRFIIQKFITAIRATRYCVRESRTTHRTRTYLPEWLTPSAEIGQDLLFATRATPSTPGGQLFIGGGV